MHVRKNVFVDGTKSELQKGYCCYKTINHYTVNLLWGCPVMDYQYSVMNY